MLKKISKWLVVIGAINWGLIGLLNLNLVTLLFGKWPMIVTAAYVLVGAAGMWGAIAMIIGKKKKKK